MKAILVIDMPRSCAECPLRTSLEANYLYCIATLPRLKIDPMTAYHIKEHRCPLKPMPKELSTPYMFRQEMIALGLQNEDGTVSVYSEDYMYGWNDCIEEIENG